MEFPDGARGVGFTSYSKSTDRFRAIGARGWIELEPAFAYRGLNGQTSGGALDIPNIAQQTAQIDDFAECILTGRATPVPGEMGRDHTAVIEAIHTAARTGRRIDVRTATAPAVQFTSV